MLNRYVLWQPDPSAVAVDAFMFPRKGENLVVLKHDHAALLGYMHVPLPWQGGVGDAHLRRPHADMKLPAPSLLPKHLVTPAAPKAPTPLTPQSPKTLRFDTSMVGPSE